MKVLKDAEGAEEQDKDNKVAKELFFSEDRKMGRVSLSVFMNVLNKLGGWGWFLFIYSITQVFTFLNMYANSYLLKWSENLNSDDKWKKMVFLIKMTVYINELKL